MKIKRNKPNILYLQSCLYGPLYLSYYKLSYQKVYIDGHTDIMIDVYSCTFMNQQFYIKNNFWTALYFWVISYEAKRLLS